MLAIFLAVLITLFAMATNSPAFLLIAGILLMIEIAGQLLAGMPKQTTTENFMCVDGHDWVHDGNDLVCAKCKAPYQCPPHKWEPNEQGLLVCKRCKIRPSGAT